MVGLPPARRGPSAPPTGRKRAPSRTASPASPSGVVVRGTYEPAAWCADADVMVWWHAETSEGACRTPTSGSAAPLSPGSKAGLVAARCTGPPSSTRPRARVPHGRGAQGAPVRLPLRPVLLTENFLEDDGSAQPACRARQMPARGYPDVRANTVGSLRPSGDYEWILAFEADGSPDRRPDAATPAVPARATGVEVPVPTPAPAWSRRAGRPAAVGRAGQGTGRRRRRRRSGMDARAGVRLPAPARGLRVRRWVGQPTAADPGSGRARRASPATPGLVGTRRPRDGDGHRRAGALCRPGRRVVASAVQRPADRRLGLGRPPGHLRAPGRDPLGSTPCRAPGTAAP